MAARTWARLSAVLAGRRVVVTTDGRLGAPDIVQYRIERGRHAGRLLSVPPTLARHPDPASTTRPPITSPTGAKAWAEWRPSPRYGLPYVVVVHDWPRYRYLCAIGFIDAPMHRGGGR